MLLLAAAWCGAAVLGAAVLGRAIRTADQRDTYVPQLDVPLWRGTDLEPASAGKRPRVCGACRDGDHADCMVESPSFLCPCTHEPAELRPTVSDGLAGAILGLAYATDEDTARYWLAVAARRGADWQMQQQLWDAWQAEQRANVTYLHADRKDPRP